MKSYDTEVKEPCNQNICSTYPFDKIRLIILNPRRNPKILAATYLAFKEQNISLTEQNLPLTEYCWLFNSIHLNKPTDLIANFRIIFRSVNIVPFHIIYIASVNFM